ncbi:hypothetical protein Peur_003259 [Populus x canadensis]
MCASIERLCLFGTPWALPRSLSTSCNSLTGVSMTFLLDSISSERNFSTVSTAWRVEVLKFLCMSLLPQNLIVSMRKFEGNFLFSSPFLTGDLELENKRWTSCQ